MGNIQYIYIYIYYAVYLYIYIYIQMCLSLVHGNVFTSAFKFNKALGTNIFFYLGRNLIWDVSCHRTNNWLLQARLYGLCNGLCYISINIYTYLYIYRETGRHIYIYRDRERERLIIERYMNICVYICIDYEWYSKLICIHLSIYIYT